jgi:hypothetical protein
MICLRNTENNLIRQNVVNYINKSTKKEKDFSPSDIEVLELILTMLRQKKTCYSEVRNLIWAFREGYYPEGQDTKFYDEDPFINDFDTQCNVAKESRENMVYCKECGILQGFKSYDFYRKHKKMLEKKQNK